jgi:flagellar protein FlaG
MSNDVGMIKAVLPTASQSGPAAPGGRTAEAERTKDSSGSAERSKQVEQDQKPLKDVVSELNNLVRELHRELRFSVDDESGDTVIRVVDSETEEVVRQIPSEEVVRMRKHLQEAAGVIFQDSA